ncbi:site-specific DNA-methyltransferase [Roseiarcaceae bacterium H3SJ34-1]|uniref:site-specific DNA-methyltransferase n=1 Tax=Terripilifer ovatus TaxID=3032367 RepID=UPI003AB9BB45|nr:site-specific DNA-methyltransferase [Roseiarcaceae bacterium H3SJ34-1]
MSVRKQRLELTWIGKDERPHLEPRILLEDADKSYHAKAHVTENDIFDNILIHGDNLLALKALEQEFEGQIKCIYIDPPYNTGSAFRFYDDGVEHSIYLSLMRDRISILHRLLRKDGCFFVQADDNEGHYIKALCDEIFGRANFIATFIWKKVDSPNDNKVAVTPDHEFIFAYAKAIEHVALRQRPDGSLLDAYIGPDEEGRYYRDRLLKKNGKASLRSDRPSMWFPIPGPDGKDVYPIHDDGREARWASGKESVNEALRDGTLIWKNRGSEDDPKWVPYTREYASQNPSRPFPTLWTDLPTTRQTKAHQKDLFGAGNEFDTPKPEALIERVFQVCTSPGDLVLDSFAGSGTTGAVAHKMGRRWIMVELGEHCETHIVPRLHKVIDGDDPGGLTEAVEWGGGGGFRYYRLAPSLLEKDAWDNWVIAKDYYDPAKLAQAVCKLMGFVYQPDETHYWMQGRSSETDFIYVTTQSLTHEQLAAIAEEVGDERTLLVCCKAFHANADAFPNLTIRKIPQAVLRKCEWGKDDYSLSVANLPEAPREQDEPDDPRVPPKVRRKNGGKAAPQDDLFSGETGK